MLGWREGTGCGFAQGNLGRAESVENLKPSHTTGGSLESLWKSRKRGKVRIQKWLCQGGGPSKKWVRRRQGEGEVKTGKGVKLEEVKERNREGTPW